MTPAEYLAILDELHARLQVGIANRPYLEALDWARPILRRLEDAVPKRELPRKVAGTITQGSGR